MIQALRGARFEIKIASKFEKATTSNTYEQTIYFIKCFSLNRKRISSISPLFDRDSVVWKAYLQRFECKHKLLTQPEDGRIKVSSPLADQGMPHLCFKAFKTTKSVLTDIYKNRSKDIVTLY